MRRRANGAGVGEPAQRSVRRWSDVRLWAGVVVLILSMFVGARVVAGDEGGRAVWQAAGDLAAGSTPVNVKAVMIADESLAQSYVSADEILDGELRWPIAEGELIPRSALVPSQTPRADERRVTVPVEEVHMPVTLQAGDRVDLWATADDDPVGSVLVASSVMVDQVSREAASMGGHVAVVLRIPAPDVASVIAAIRNGDIDLVYVPLESQGMS